MKRASYQTSRCRAYDHGLRCDRGEHHEGMHRAEVQDSHGDQLAIHSWRTDPR